MSDSPDDQMPRLAEPVDKRQPHAPFVDVKGEGRVWEFVIVMHAAIPGGAVVEGAMPLIRNGGHVPFAIAMDMEVEERKLCCLGYKVFYIRVKGSPGWCNCREGLWPIMGIVLINGAAKIVKDVYIVGDDNAENRQLVEQYNSHIHPSGFYRAQSRDKVLRWKDPSFYFSSFVWNARGEKVMPQGSMTHNKLNPAESSNTTQLFEGSAELCKRLGMAKSTRMMQVATLRTAAFRKDGWTSHPLVIGSNAEAGAGEAAADSSAAAGASVGVPSDKSTVLGKRVADDDLCEFVGETTLTERNARGFDAETNKSLIDITGD
jgi:hypothetical protein